MWVYEAVYAEESVRAKAEKHMIAGSMWRTTDFEWKLGM